jgi:subtilisin family serine protease
MTKQWYFIIFFLASWFFGISIYASDGESVTVYAQASLPISEETCTKFEILFEVNNYLQPSCKFIHKKSGKIQFHWQLANQQTVQKILNEATNSHIIEWYEFRSEIFTTHSLGDIASLPRSSTKFDTFSSSSSGLISWFVSPSIKKLTTALQAYDANHSIVVAIIDSGVNFQGFLETAKIWENPKEISNDGLDNDGNGYIDDIHGWDFVETGSFSIFDDTTTPDNNPSDRLGHGTAVAAILLKTVGAEFSTFVQIMPLRVASNSSGSGTVEPSALAEAIYYAADNGANIINISLASNQNYILVKDAIFYAINNDIKIVSAAGNSGGQVMFPASIPGVVSVGAYDINGTIWSGSASGNSVDLFAPGVNMLNALGVYTFNVSESGTSFAAPVVSGVLAMMMSFGHGDGCTDIRSDFLKVGPASKNIDDYLAMHSYRIEQQILAGTDLEIKWKTNAKVCGANSFTVNALLR